MPALNDMVRQKKEQLSAQRRLRYLRETARQDGAHVLRGGNRLISFSCNDTLGLSHHPRVVAAAKAALDAYGAGAGASRLVSGNHPLYAELEERLAEHKGTEAALVFGSGYLANMGVIPALVGKGDLILADRLIHACMIDGAQLSGAKLLRFAHNDTTDAARLLETHRKNYHHCLMLTETVFSMDGDVAPVDELSALAKAHDAWLMTDDAHGVPSLPPARSSDLAMGRVPPKAGFEEVACRRHDAGSRLARSADRAFFPIPDLQMGTLSKAFGAYGGYVCASREVIDYLASAARSVVYSTGLPPSAIASAIAAMEVMEETPELCARPLRFARIFTSAMGLPEAQSHIVPWIVGSEESALAMAAMLEEQGFLVSAIRPPTVPEGTSRLRFSFSALHEERDILRLAECLKS